MANGVAWLNSNGQETRLLKGPPLGLAEMRPHHAAAWRSFLEECKRLRAARRGSPTGAKAVEIITKSDTVSYGAVGPPDTPYTPLRASLIAEPSRPQRVVPMLGALPPELSRYYSKESNVLASST